MALGELKRGGSMKYLRISPGAIIAEKSTEDDIKATKREYEDANGKKGYVFERQSGDISGMITNITFNKGNYGEEFSIFINDQDEKYKLTMNLAQTKDTYYANSFLSKLKGIDFSKQVTIKPYDFTTKDGKKKTLVVVTQDGEKLQNAYRDYKTGKLLVKGYPTISDWSNASDEEKQMYNIQLRSFYKKEVVKLKFDSSPKSDDKPKSDSDSDDLPF